MARPKIYDDGLSKQARKSRADSAAGAEIGELPEVVNPARKESCRLDLEKFLVTYFPHSTGLKPFSDDHKRVIARIQDVILRGGREAKACYRGFAKTTIAENSTIWATGYGHRRYPALFGANDTMASGNMDSIKKEIEQNDLLYEDFPEMCHAVRALEGKAQRCKSQTYQGELTNIQWTSDRIALAFIPGAACSGAVVSCHGITAGARGLKHKTPDGKNQRPDLILVDDPQTDESAVSPTQVQKRLSVIKKVLLRLGGHASTIALIVNGTVIAKDDLMDQLTDHQKNPSFQSERLKMIRSWSAAHDTLWMDQYAKIRNTYDPQELGAQERAHAAANEFYRTNREQMDAGCAVSWEHCYDPDRELSAIQHAYNILIDDGLEVFSSECQNEPVDPMEGDGIPTARGIANRINNLARGMLPRQTQRLVCFVDVQQKCLFYLVCAFQDDFTAAIVDYGAFPDQRREYFDLAGVRRTLAMALSSAGFQGGLEASIEYGLRQLTESLLAKAWTREDGSELRIERLLIDSGWGESTDTIYEFCRRTSHGAIVMPSKGVGIKAGDKPMSEWPKKDNERPGFHFVLTNDAEKRTVRLCKYDTNHWKTFVANRVNTLGPGGLTVFGSRSDEHRMLADHFNSEFATKTTGRGRTVWEWKAKPNHDNHLFDCIVGCYAAAAVQGCRLPETRTSSRKKSPRVSYF